MILALDLGTKAGWAFRANGVVYSGTTDFKPQRFEGGGMRYVRFTQMLNSFHKTEAITSVYFEEVRAHKGIDAAHVYGGFMATLTGWCEHHKVPYSGIPVQKIKSFATGKGNANKDAVIAGVRRLGYNPKDDNEADAIALLLFAEKTNQ